MDNEEIIKELRKSLSEIVFDVRDIKLVLKGYNGDKGLCEKFENLAADYYQFKRKVFFVIGILVGSGVLTTGVISYFVGT